MRKKILLLIICMVITSICILPVSAHSGGTDSKGGHWDHSTGEYHYHHGYGPHDHYDMDGDGDEDCPYEFDSRVIGITSTSVAYDKGYSAGKKDGYSSGFDDGYDDGKTDAEEAAKIKIEEAKEDARNNAYLCAALYGAPAVALFTGWWLDRSHKRDEQYYKKEIDRLKKDLNAEKNKNTLQSIHPNGVMPADIPADITLNLSCTPIKGRSTAERPYGEYTVYTTASGKKYHYKYRCCNATTPQHLFKLAKDLGPCSNCVPLHIASRKLPDWYLEITNPRRAPSKTEIPQVTVRGTIPDDYNFDSTAFSFIDYQNTVLILIFKTGGEYHYYDVPEIVYKELLIAPSKGKYYHEKIKDKYPYY